MKRFTLIFVAALLGAAVSVPAQSRNQRGQARNHRGVVATNHQPRQASVRHVQGRNLRAPRVPHQRSLGRVVRNIGRALNQHRGHRQGYWETHYDRVLVPGYWDRQHVAPTYGWIYDACGHRSWGITDHGGYRRVWIPARYENRPHRVWVGGRRGRGRY